ncbi:hypothetical protein [Pseudaestuariivita rosea]|uniref:hypothetical protein n=1 Tax=Pseudaestuariivita rosea TaxID=2763263 RepID=UPI001ABA92D7|nr:hypothetical protein [Pseudaestuariivita rosea]
MIDWTEFKVAIVKATVVLLPSYTAAYLTGQMVWVVPTLAASGFLAASIQKIDTAETRVEQEADFETDVQTNVYKEAEVAG